MLSKLRVALIHEHLAQDGGAERVLLEFSKMFPQAPIYTLVYNRQRANPAWRTRDIRPSFLQRLPGGVRYYQWYLNYMPTAVERYDLSDYDLVLSSASSFAKGVITDPKTLHVCYLHSPTRYLWNDTHRYVDELRYSRLIRALIPFSLTRIRMWDRLAADRVDEFIANSKEVQRRIRKYYQRSSTVIYPPVEVNRFRPVSQVGNYYLTGGRLVPYKRFDLAIRAFNRLGLPLKIFGAGSAEKDLRTMAKPNIEFVGRLDDTAMSDLYSHCLAFLNPQEEDFGITVIEAMAAGRPVIAYAAGGALETVQPGKTGVLFKDQEWEALADAVIRFKPEQFSSAIIRDWAVTFGPERFHQQLGTYLETAWKNYQSQLHS